MQIIILSNIENNYVRHIINCNHNDHHNNMIYNIYNNDNSPTLADELSVCAFLSKNTIIVIEDRSDMIIITMN